MLDAMREPIVEK